jgi:hypothetical protein
VGGKIKTSSSHPLQIQSVTPRGTSGKIGMTICPGRKGSSAEGGSWDRDLQVDLEAVRAWNPDIALALLEEHEYARLGIPHFREAVAKARLPWEFAPIPDGCVPGREFNLAWRETAPRVRTILHAGGRALIHCRAGLGRTGLVAACLLVDFGATPQEAIDSVRAARPNTIETAEQERYVRSNQRELSRLMPLATMCCRCSHQWILNEASPRLWICPSCGAKTEKDSLLRCACRHSYRKHDTRRHVEDSFTAMTLAGHLAMKDIISKIPLRPAPPNPPIGSCLSCDCTLYRRSRGGTLSHSTPAAAKKNRVADGD